MAAAGPARSPPDICRRSASTRGKRQPSSTPDALIGAWLTGTSITGQPSRWLLASSSLAECHGWRFIQVFERTKQGVRCDHGMGCDPGPDRLDADVTP